MLSNSALNGENVGITAPSNDIDKKRCPRCHANLPNDSMFCQFCGTRLSASEPVSPNSLATDIQKERNAAILKRIETQKAADKRNKIIKIIARSVAIVLVTIGIISYAISDAKKSSYNNELRNFATETMSDDYTNVYADVTLMRPEYFIYSTSSQVKWWREISRVVCKCTTEEYKTIWIVVDIEQYPGGSATSEEQNKTQYYASNSPKRVTGKVTTSGKVMKELEKRIGDVFMIDVTEKIDK